ncbi:hypothetical protein LPJ66_007621 [Kickxella alabastrina]|uniref:Uncharacterized protein n=1 Tax=Kickxella alabastrina TaxID=61397 RepID=A0ACC1I9S5_9FUNG|nr:hypothetical protein LPJ66_007621 [Kickxella alabastrina]
MSGLGLKRRSQMGQTALVRKSDIRVVDRSSCDFDEFQAAQSVGSGDNNDVCFQRLTGWMHAVENYQEFFRSMAAAELDLATVYARIGDILKVPMREGALFLPAAAGDGVQSVTRQLKDFQQLMVENHCAISSAAKDGALAELKELHSEVRALMASYTEAVQPAFRELEQCRTSVRRRAEVLAAAIAEADSAKDPFIISLEVEALLRKRAELERHLSAQRDAQLQAIGGAEPQLTERLAVVVSVYVDVVSERHRRLRVAAKRDTRALRRVDGRCEWAAFEKAHRAALYDPACSDQECANRDCVDHEYAGRDSEWVRVLRQGVVAMRETGPLFRSTWQSKYGVLTTRGFFHVFRSQGDVVRGAPETSVFLPRARIEARRGLLQIIAGSRFSRGRIVIQDAQPSLDNWRLLMESTMHSEAPGLATPTPSSAESSPNVSPVHVRGSTQWTTVASKPQADRTQGWIDVSVHTPTRRGRPFSVDVSMLGQQSTHIFHGTTSSNMYLRPLESAPKPLAPLSPTADSPSFDEYSPGFSADSPAPGSQSSSSGSSNLSGSRFGSSGSKDSETAPIASLPGLSSIASHAMRLGPRGDEFNADIWHSDVLRVADAAAKSRPRPRSMLEDPSAGVLDLTNPYLGDFLTKRNQRGTRSSAASTAVQSSVWRSNSVYLQASETTTTATASPQSARQAAAASFKSLPPPLAHSHNLVSDH